MTEDWDKGDKAAIFKITGLAKGGPSTERRAAPNITLIDLPRREHLRREN